MSIKNICGIAGIETYFPESVRSYKYIAEKSGIPEDVVKNSFGINQVYYPAEDQTVSWMASRAASRCLSQTKTDPGEIDLIIYFGENYADYQNWSIGPKIQKEIDAVNAWSYDLDCKCASAIIALEQARNYIAQDDSINTVMLSAGYRNVDRVDYEDTALTFLFNVSCGGMAAIVKRGYPDLQILESTSVCDGSFADAIAVPGGGTIHPITPDNVNDKYYKYFRLLQPGFFKEKIGEVTYDNLIKVTERACRKSGIVSEDIDYLAVLHMKASAHRAILEKLGLNMEQSTYLADYGHIGQLDPLLSLKLGIESEKLLKGGYAALLSMGLGYIWSSLILRF